MAKTYNTVLATSLQKMYTEKGPLQTPILAAAQGSFRNLNGMNNIQMIKVGGPGARKWKMEIQRRLRIKSKASDVTTDLGDQIIARLNAASKSDWETVTAFPAAKRDFLVAVEVGDAENFSNNPADFSDGFDQAAQVLMIEDEETAIDMIVQSVTADATKYKIMTADFTDLEAAGEELFDKLIMDVQRIGLYVDKFVHFSSVNQYVHPLAAAAMRIFKGQSFQVSQSAYADNLLADFSTDGITSGYTDAHFNKVVEKLGTADDHRLMWISAGDDSFFDAGYTSQVTSLNTMLLDIQFSGHSYYKCQGIIDADRIRAGFAKISDAVLAASDKVGA